MKELKINNQNLSEIINDILYKSNRIFVSEADFQFFFAWELKEKLKKNYDIILEYPINKGKMEYIDIVIVDKNNDIISCIELKYKTVEYTIKDKIKLKDQQARDLGNYLFIKDVKRMERQKSKYFNYCIFLTNDKNYWSGINKNNVLDKNFKLYEGNHIQKKLKWNLNDKQKKKKKHWTKDYNNLKNLSKEYCCKWKIYQNNNNKKNSEFKYLLFSIPSQYN